MATLPVIRKYIVKEGGIINQDSDSDDIKPRIDAHFGPWNSTDEYFAWARKATQDTSFTPPSGVSVGILQSDGTVKEYMWQKPDDGEGYWKDESYVIESIGGAVYFDNILSLKASTELHAGDIVITKGYYEADDGGGSTFRVVDSSSSALNIYEGNHVYKGKAYERNWKQLVSEETSPYVDDATLVGLQNDLYADIIVPANREISFLQMGARKIYPYSRTVGSSTTRYSVQNDNKPYMMKWLAFNDRRMTTYNLFIPAGAYSFSETWLLRNDKASCACGIRIRGECMQHNSSATTFMPHYYAQEYIIRIGHRTRANGSYAGSGSSDWYPMRDTVFNDICFGTARGAISSVGYALRYGAGGIGGTLDPNDDATAGTDNYRYVKRGALWLDACPYSQFDGLYFQNVAGTCIHFTQCYESHFGYMNVRDCGRIEANGYANPLFYFKGPGPSDISACYFYYFNFEGCYGHYFYGHPGWTNFTHCEFNNIQIEGSVPPGVATDNPPYIGRIVNQKYTTDPGYTVPEFKDSGGNVTAVFGKWYKWYVFTGTIGYMANYVNSISVSNFGNGYKKYRTYSNDNGVIHDIDGNVITDGYIEEGGKIYAVDSNGYKIVDFYRYYALFGVDKDTTPANESSMCVDIGSIYFNRDLTSYKGPWVVYANCVAAVHNIHINKIYKRDEYPYYLEGTGKIHCPREQMSVVGATPFYEMLVTASYKAWAFSHEGAVSPNALVVKRTSAVYPLWFTLMPHTRYVIRAYAPTSAYNTLYNRLHRNNVAYISWQNVIYLNGDTSNPYVGSETCDVESDGWIYLTLPDLGIEKPTKVGFYGNAGFSSAFVFSLYLDYIAVAGAL